MNDSASPVWTSGSSEAYHTGTWRSAVPDYINPPSPCHSACPVGGNIALWIQQVRERDYHGAWLTLMANNPFPAIAGRICHHPCEPACNRGAYDQPIAICALERFVGDQALAQGWSCPQVPITRSQRIAIVGGGPAGLSAAYHLRRAGYAVTVYEAQAELGGLLRYGIPPYRLAKDILDGEIRRILDLGVEVRTGCAINSREDFDELRREYEALYLAPGAGVPKRLPVLDYTRPWVVDGADYLARTNAGEAPSIGTRVVVIGGGSAAMDVARTARRHRRDVTILTLEPEELLPCQREEVTESREEDIRLVNAAMLEAVTEAPGGLQLQCIRIRFLPQGERGRFSVERVPGTDFTLEADTIVTSIGQDPDLAVLGQVLDTDGPLIRIDAGQRTSRDGVFAGGDAASMERFVTHAVGMGKDVARDIDRYFFPERPRADRKRINRYLQEDRVASTRDCTADVGVGAINTWYYDKLERISQAVIPATERLRTFDEVQVNLSPDAAHAEAGRCFSCGNCIFCDNCFNYCPDMAITRLEQGYRIKPDYCKGCGLCVKECPTGAIAMFEDRQ